MDLTPKQEFDVLVSEVEKQETLAGSLLKLVEGFKAHMEANGQLNIASRQALDRFTSSAEKIVAAMMANTEATPRSKAKKE